MNSRAWVQNLRAKKDGNFGDLERRWAVIEATLAAAGIDIPRHGRIRAYVGSVQEAVSSRIENGLVDMPGERAVLLHQGSSEFHELEIAVNVLGRNPRWKAKFQQMVKGAEHPEEDSPDSPLARSSQFELYVAALLSQAGMKPIPGGPGQPDILCTHHGWPISVEAKRIRSEEQLEKRCRKAKNQIVESKRPGIVALEVTGIVNPKLQTLQIAREMEGQDVIAGLFREFVSTHGRRIRDEWTLTPNREVFAMLTFVALRTWEPQKSMLGCSKSCRLTPLCADTDPRIHRSRVLTREMYRALHALT